MKKLILFILCLFMAATLAGCSGGGGSSDNNNINDHVQLTGTVAVKGESNQSR